MILKVDITHSITDRGDNAVCRCIYLIDLLDREAKVTAVTIRLVLACFSMYALKMTAMATPIFVPIGILCVCRQCLSLYLN